MPATDPMPRELHAAEWQLVRHTARPLQGPAEHEQTRELAAHNLDAAVLIRLADAHRVLPALHRGLTTAFPGGVPGSWWPPLNRRMHTEAGRNLLLAHALLQVLDWFRRHGITAQPFKGPVLAVHLYQNLSARQFVDLDLLVPHHQVLDARRLLLTLGFRSTELADESEAAGHLRSPANYHFHMARKDGVSVELHWQIMPRSLDAGLNPAAASEPHAPVQLLGSNLTHATGPALVRYLAAHEARHYWSRLGGLRDIATAILSQPGLDWPQLLDQSRQYGCRRVLLVSLSLAKSTIHLPLDPAVDTALDRDRTARALAHTALRRLHPPHALGLAAMHAHHLQLRERFRDRRLYFTDYLRKGLQPRPADRAAWDLPTPFRGLQRLVRPARVIARFFRRR